MKDDKHTPGYEVTNDGFVYSISSNWRGYGKRLMIPTTDTDGYLRVRLTINGTRSNYPIHKLVAVKFIGKRPTKRHQIRHIDGNKLNNHYTNLAWGTAKDNADDRERHGNTSRGEKHSKLIKQGIYANR